MTEIIVTVSGPVGCGKSAIAGEIEIALRAVGVPVRFADEKEMRSEKNMTAADWTGYLEMYKPTVVIAEQISSQSANDIEEISDPICREADGCPTEMAVLKRFWRSHQNPAPLPNVRVTAEEYNKAFDAANEALGGAFMAGFREGWIYAEIDADGERYQEMAEEFALAVDSAPQEAWDAHRAEFFNMLPLAALPEVPDNG